MKQALGYCEFITNGDSRSGIAKNKINLQTPPTLNLIRKHYGLRVTVVLVLF